MRLIITLLLPLLVLLSSFTTMASSALITRFDRLSLEHGLFQTTVYSGLVGLSEYPMDAFGKNKFDLAVHQGLVWKVDVLT